MKKFVLVLFVLLVVMLPANAQASIKRNLFEDTFEAVLKEGVVFTAAGDWVPYPSYSDREAWDKLSVIYKKQLIEDGEKSLKYKWESIPASVFLEYEKILS